MVVVVDGRAYDEPWMFGRVGRDFPIARLHVTVDQHYIIPVLHPITHHSTRLMPPSSIVQSVTVMKF
jgi:hypothetical protein